MDNKLAIQFLKSFFSLFNAKIETFIVTGLKIMGVVGFDDDEEKQEFSWTFENQEAFTIKSIQLCDYLKVNNCIRMDCITISEHELICNLAALGSERNEAQKSIDFLMLVEVKMIDEGGETDSFFIHF